MALIEDYYKNLHNDAAQDKRQISELSRSIIATQEERDDAVAVKEKIVGVAQTLVEKMRSNSVAYNLVKKWDVWQEIEKLAGSN